MDEARDRIVRLEERIEELAAAIESCRKFMLAARAAIAAGAVLLIALAFGLVTFSPMAMVAAFAAVLGGIVLLGSNSSTSDQANAELRAAEAERAALIGEIDLQVVGGDDWRRAPAAPPTLH